MNTQSFPERVKQQLEYLYQDIHIPLNPIPPTPLTPLYSYSPHPPLAIPELRYIVEQQQASQSQQEHLLANKILYFLNNLIRVLQNNEQCRLYWTIEISKGRHLPQNKINFADLEQQVNKLNQIIQECKYGATSKSELKNILEVKRKEIFLWKDDTKFIRNMKEIILPEMPEIFQSYKMLNQDTYLILYESTLQRLLIYQNAIQQFLQNRLSFQQFQQLCSELMRQDIIVASNKTLEIIKFTWVFCNDQIAKFNYLRNKIYKLRSTLALSIHRTYYISFISKLDIEQLYQSLTPIQNYIMQSFNPNDKNGISLGRNSIIVEVNQDKMIYLQLTFNKIFDYLTEAKETIFINLYNRKLKKRVYRLTEIENTLTHLHKLKFNPDYAQNIIQQKYANANKNQQHFRDNFQKLKDYYNEIRPPNDNQFRIVFEQLQRISLMRDQQEENEQQYKVLQFEKMILNDHLFNEKGERKVRKDGPMQRFTKSIVNDQNKINNLNHYQVKKQEVFQETIDQLHGKPYNASNNSQNYEMVDPNQVYQEGKDYILSIRPEFGQEFMDLINFRAYLLPKIQRQSQIALSQTPYAVQPLHLQLANLLEHLNLINQIIRTDLNQKKIDLIFFPKVNSSLLSVLKNKMLQHQQKLSNIYVQIRENAIKANTLQPNIKLFIENRLRYLYVLLQNIDKLQQIALHISQLTLVKNTYDITSEMTYNIVLRLLLAEKEIKAYQLSLRDRLNDKTLAQKALKLLSEYIYPNFINSLSIVFQNLNKNNAYRSLQDLLNLAEESKKLLTESNQSLDSIIAICEGILNRQISRNIIEALQSFRMTLNNYFTRAEYLINESNGYSNISSEALAVQRLRIFEFMEICEYGPQLKTQILDQRSKNLLQILRRVGL